MKILGVLVSRVPRPSSSALLALCGLAACLLSAGAAHAVQKSVAQLQLEFGVKVALKGSWGEAAFRFEKAAKADGRNARAYNNLGVARENLGQFEAAKEAYEKALSLDPEDARIRENYERLLNFMKSHRQVDGAP